jgi:hypothetical protein
MERFETKPIRLKFTISIVGYGIDGLGSTIEGLK